MSALSLPYPGCTAFELQSLSIFGTLEQPSSPFSTSKENRTPSCCSPSHLHPATNCKFVAGWTVMTFEVIHQTQGRVFHQVSKHWLRSELKKTRRNRVFLTNFSVSWYLMKHSFECFNIASQSLNNSSRNSRQKSTEFYDNWDHISKLLHGSEFLVFFTWIVSECENAKHNPLKSTIIGKQGCPSGGISLKVIYLFYFVFDFVTNVENFLW